ncbi:MAG: hypothetical protein MUE81_11775 [Thermoflexibacter sp.]|nr:hypothetical protein [Thermoflexibacter sp.]
MPYSEFLTLKQVENKFGLESKITNLYEQPIPKVGISPFLQNDLQEAKEFPLSSEKAKSEAIIAPILRELRRQHKIFSFFSGYTFDVDASNSLNGVCDFLLTLRTDKTDITAPVFCIVEAKNRTIDEGLGQCAAEMYAAYLFNQQEGEDISKVYGCVTTANEWRFLKYENKVVYIDKDLYYLIQVEEILGIMLWILEQFKK